MQCNAHELRKRAPVGPRTLTERTAIFSSSLFERDCAQAGLPKGSLVSPALVKIIKAQNQALALHSAERDAKGLHSDQRIRHADWVGR
jgi:hypothetical protein